MRNMTRKTITNIFIFVISVISSIAFLSSCSERRTDDTDTIAKSNYLPPKKVGNLADPEISEASGIVASRCNPGIFWTHNDSGDSANIYAIAKTGESLGIWNIPRSANNDWEDIAEYKDTKGKCFLYVGDIGDNSERISEHSIYRVQEPHVSTHAVSMTAKDIQTTDTAEVLRFKYPDGPHNAETLMVGPNDGEIYVVTKNRKGPAAVFRLNPEFDLEAPVPAEKIAEITVPAIMKGLITGGDIAPDGRHMILCDYVSGYEFTLPNGESNFNEIWSQPPEIVDVGDRRIGESVCYSQDGNALYSTSEGVGAPVYEILRK